MAATKVFPMSCRKPKWVSKSTITESKTVKLDDENAIIFIKNALNKKTVDEYIKAAVAVKRVRGTAVFNHKKPRYELFYWTKDKKYEYSRIKHETTAYPEHVTSIIREIEDVIASTGDDNLPHFGKLDITGDILYDATLPQGGRIGAHSDNERMWPIVIIFSLGQTRYLRLTTMDDKSCCDVEMTHNSIVVMAGDTFQRTYRHRVDFLAKSELVGTRLSLNIRYRPVKQVKRRRV